MKEKFEIVQFCMEHSTWSIRKITQVLNELMNRPLGKTTIGSIIKNKDEIINNYNRLAVVSDTEHHQAAYEMCPL